MLCVVQRPPRAGTMGRHRPVAHVPSSSACFPLLAAPRPPPHPPTHVHEAAREGREGGAHPAKGTTIIIIAIFLLLMMHVRPAQHTGTTNNPKIRNQKDLEMSTGAARPAAHLHEAAACVVEQHHQPHRRVTPRQLAHLQQEHGSSVGRAGSRPHAHAAVAGRQRQHAEA